MSTFGYNDSKTLLTALGKFWSAFYSQKDFIQKTLGAIAIDWENEYFRFCENVLSLSLKDIPVFNRERWRNIKLLESQINVDTGNFAKYGEGLVYGEEEVLYGGKFDGVGASFLLEDIAEINGVISNRIYNPSLVLIENSDFNFSNGVIHFKQNPFANPLVPIREIANEDNEVVDRELSLWISEIHTDRQYLWKHYGSLFDLFEQSSEDYKVLLRTLLSVHMNGAKIRYALGFLNAALGLPIIIENYETIKHLIREDGNITIITDRNQYETIDEALSNQIVVGNTLQEFTPIHSFVQILDQKRTPDWWINRGFLSIPQSLLDEGYLTDIIVRNETVRIPNRVGETWEFSFQGSVTPEKQAQLSNMGLRVGQKGFIVGAESVRINYLDLVADIVKNNLFAIEFDPTKGDSARFNRLVDTFFRDLIPVHCAFTVINNINISETYDTEENVSDSIEVKEGKTIVEQIEPGVEVQDGYFGLPRVGFFSVNQPNLLVHPEEVAPTPVQVGRPMMHTGPLILFRRNGRCE